MKLAVRIAQNDATDNAYVVFRGFEESMKKAKELEYDGIELALGRSGEIDILQIERLLQQNDLEVSCLTTGQVFSKHHLYLTSNDPEVRQQAIDTFYDLIDVAHHFGTMINIGRARGTYTSTQTKERTEALFIDTLSYIVDRASAKDVAVIVEPLNRYETNFINTAKDCAELLYLFPPEHVGIMLDLFHMNIEETDIGETFARFGSQIKYIQFADSNKMAPGWGHIDFKNVFDGLRSSGYNGWGGVEVLRTPSADEAARQSIDFLKPYIATL